MFGISLHCTYIRFNNCSLPFSTAPSLPFPSPGNFFRILSSLFIVFKFSSILSFFLAPPQLAESQLVEISKKKLTENWTLFRLKGENFCVFRTGVLGWQHYGRGLGLGLSSARSGRFGRFAPSAPSAPLKPRTLCYSASVCLGVA